MFQSCDGSALGGGPAKISSVNGGSGVRHFSQIPTVDDVIHLVNGVVGYWARSS
jgi:hypothetical protein